MKHDPYKTIDSLLEEMAKDKETIRRLEMRIAAGQAKSSFPNSAEDFAEEVFHHALHKKS